MHISLMFSVSSFVFTLLIISLFSSNVTSALTSMKLPVQIDTVQLMDIFCSVSSDQTDQHIIPCGRILWIIFNQRKVLNLSCAGNMHSGSQALYDLISDLHMVFIIIRYRQVLFSSSPHLLLQPFQIYRGLFLKHQNEAMAYI